MHKNTISSVFNLKAQEIIQGTKIFESKRITKLLDDLSNKGKMVANDDNIIHIEKQVNYMSRVCEN